MLLICFLSCNFFLWCYIWFQHLYYKNRIFALAAIFYRKIIHYFAQSLYIITSCHTTKKFMKLKNKVQFYMNVCVYIQYKNLIIIIVWHDDMCSNRDWVRHSLKKAFMQVYLLLLAINTDKRWKNCKSACPFILCYSYMKHVNMVDYCHNKQKCALKLNRKLLKNYVLFALK